RLRLAHGRLRYRRHRTTGNRNRHLSPPHAPLSLQTDLPVLRTTDLDGSAATQADTQGNLGSVGLGGNPHRQVCQPAADGAAAPTVAALGIGSGARHGDRWFAALTTIISTASDGLAGTQSTVRGDSGRRDTLAGFH